VSELYQNILCCYQMALASTALKRATPEVHPSGHSCSMTWH